MKRFPKASYIRDQLHRVFVTAMLALAALALLGKAAHAQPCSDPDEARTGVYATFEARGHRAAAAVTDAVQCAAALFESVTEAGS